MAYTPDYWGTTWIASYLGQWMENKCVEEECGSMPANDLGTIDSDPKPEEKSNRSTWLVIRGTGS